MALYQPEDADALLRINGVGMHKLEALVAEHGEAVLGVDGHRLDHVPVGERYCEG